MIYKNKRDIFYYVFYSFTSILIFVSMFLVFGLDSKLITKIFMLIIFLLIELYLTTIMFFTSYYFTNEGLICRIGNVELSYSYDNIKSVSEGFSISLFLNTSFRCIKIKLTDGKKIRVSPINKDEFLKEMGQHGFLLQVKQKRGKKK